MAVFFTRRGAPPSLGTRLGDLEIGTIVHIKENGGYQDYLVVHQGLPSSMYDSSCNGTWLLRQNIQSLMPWNNPNSRVYKTSSINKHLQNTYINKFDSDIQGVIKTVKIPYTGDTVNEVLTGSNGLSVKLFLLASAEFGYEKERPVDGALLQYFTNTIYDDQKRVSTYNGEPAIWWGRTPFRSAGYVDFIRENGAPGSYYSSNSYGLRPALIMPPDLLVDDNNNIF